MKKPTKAVDIDGKIKDRPITKLTLSKHPDLTVRVYDTVICGAGPAGIYTAKRLKASPGHSNKRILVIEKAEKVGGRIQSTFFSEAPSVPVEPGAMRIKEGDRIMNYVVDSFKLSKRPFLYKMAFYFLKGQRVLPDKLALKGTELYHLSGKEKLKNPTELIELAIKENLGFNKLPNSEEEKVKFFRELESLTFLGDPLFSTGWINFLQAALSPAAIQFIIDADGYNSNFENLQFVEALKDILLFNNGYYRLEGGYSTVVNRMAEEFVKIGGEINLKMELFEFKSLKLGSKNSVHEEIFKELKRKHNGIMPKYVMKVKNGTTGIPEYIVANEIILALPKEAIKNLHQKTRFFNDAEGSKVPELLNSVNTMKSLKIYLQFHNDWWAGKYGLQYRKIISGGNIRMIYTIGTEGVENPSDPFNRNSVMLLYMDQAPASILPLTGDFKTPDSPITGNHAKLVDYIHNELTQLFRKCVDKDIKVPHIMNLAYKYWEEAYHTYNMNIDAKIVREKIIKPNADMDIYIIGSAYSSQQGWAEGALITSEYMLQKYFNLTPIPGVGINYIENQLFNL
jgi:hypothetical protein